MSQSYTPGLKVLTKTHSQKLRQLPLKGEVHVEKGDTVDANTIIASTNIPGNVQMLNVARQLNVEADTVPDCMLVEIDEEISKGQIIAESKGIFGFFKSQLKSPIDGLLANVSNVTGQALLSEPPIPIEVDAFSAGTIEDVIPEEGVIINTSGALVQGILGIGGENKGRTHIAVDDRTLPLTIHDIKDEYEGRIIIGGSHITLDAFKKAQEVGVKGIVVGGVDYDDLSTILGYNLGVAVTGSEEIGISLMITEGFGSIAMAKGTFDLFSEFDGEFASINGSTQIRAGVIRPEVIIPHTKDMPETTLSEADMIISEGSPVRIIRAPYFGHVGKVIDLPAPLMKMESETMVRVANVEFDNGEMVTIPRANLELILH